MKDPRFSKIQFPGLINKLDRWDDWLEVSDNTRRAYANGMLTLIRYTKDESLMFSALKKEDISNFKEWMLSSTYSSSTIALYLAGVRSFYRFLAEIDEEQADIAHRIKGPKTPKRFKKEPLTRQQAKELLASIDQSTLQGLRDYALINLMIRTGLRDIEVSRAVFWDIDFSLDSETAVLHVQGKGRLEKDDFVVLEEQALSPIRSYLSARRDALKKKPQQGGQSTEIDDNAPLFASLAHNHPDAPLTTRSISRIVKNRLCAIGLTGPQYSAHSLRHTAVTFSLLGGASVQEAQAMARHANINTTLIYAHDVNRLKNAAESKAGTYLDFEEENSQK